MNLAGDQGEALANESVRAVRDIVHRIPPPPGVSAYVTGPAPLVADMNRAGDDSILKITIVTVVVILAMLLFVYRSIITVFFVLLTVGVQVQVARGVVALLADQRSYRTFNVRRQSVGIARDRGGNGLRDILLRAVSRGASGRRGPGNGLLHHLPQRHQGGFGFGSDHCRGDLLPELHPAAVFPDSWASPARWACSWWSRWPSRCVPAVIAVGSRFGLFEPKRKIAVRRWRRVGTAIVRWPGPILAATCALALVGLLALPAYQTSYNDRLYVPQDIPANVGYAAAERHFPQSRMMPEILMIESDHDMRNPTDFLVLHKLAKAVFAVPGISRVQGITRPEGTPIERTSIPFLISMQNASQIQILPFQQERIERHAEAGRRMTTMIDLMQRNL